MSNRQRLAREKLEIYLVHLLMAYRPLVFIVGSLLMLYSIVSLFASPLVAFASLIPALVSPPSEYSLPCHPIHSPIGCMGWHFGQREGLIDIWLNDLKLIDVVKISQ